MGAQCTREHGGADGLRARPQLCFAALLALTLLHLLRVCCLRVYAGPVDDGFDTEDGMATVSFDGDSPSLKGDGCKGTSARTVFTRELCS